MKTCADERASPPAMEQTRRGGQMLAWRCAAEYGRRGATLTMIVQTWREPEPASALRAVMQRSGAAP